MNCVSGFVFISSWNWLFWLVVDVTASVSTSPVTVYTVQPGLATVFRGFVAAFLTDWIHTLRYTEGTRHEHVYTQDEGDVSSTFLAHQHKATGMTMEAKQNTNGRSGASFSDHSVVIISSRLTVIRFLFYCHYHSKAVLQLLRPNRQGFPLLSTTKLWLKYDKTCPFCAA